MYNGKVEMLLLHKSDIFVPPIWYTGDTFETSSVSMSSDPRAGTAKTERHYRLKNLNNGGELSTSEDALKEDFHVIKVKFDGVVSKQENSILDYIEELRGYRNQLMVSLVNGKANYSSDQKDSNGVGDSAFKMATVICIRMFNEKFN